MTGEVGGLRGQVGDLSAELERLKESLGLRERDLIDTKRKLQNTELELDQKINE